MYNIPPSYAALHQRPRLCTSMPSDLETHAKDLRRNLHKCSLANGLPEKYSRWYKAMLQVCQRHNLRIRLDTGYQLNTTYNTTYTYTYRCLIFILYNCNLKFSPSMCVPFSVCSHSVRKLLFAKIFHFPYNTSFVHYRERCSTEYRCKSLLLGSHCSKYC